MAESVPTAVPIDEHDLYPAHEEDTVPEPPEHFWQEHYLAGALRVHRPDLWVTGNTCLYWERGNKEKYVAPDVAVIEQPPPQPQPRVWFAWQDAPLLFVCELKSESTFRRDTGPKVEIFEQLLLVPEYLYVDPTLQTMTLWRMVEGSYHMISPGEDGRVWSAALGVSFGFDAAGLLRAYTAEGEVLRTHEESEREREELRRRVAELEAELRRSRGE